MEITFCFGLKQIYMRGTLLEVFSFPHCGFLNKCTSAISKLLWASECVGFFPPQNEKVLMKSPEFYMMLPFMFCW